MINPKAVSNQIMAYLNNAERAPVTAKEIALALKRKQGTVSATLTMLVRNGAIRSSNKTEMGILQFQYVRDIKYPLVSAAQIKKAAPRAKKTKTDDTLTQLEQKIHTKLTWAAYRSGLMEMIKFVDTLVEK